jgi:cell division protein FtsB
MSHTHATYMPTGFGTAEPPSRRRSQVARRRRLLLLVVCAFILTLAALANYGPLHSYLDARSRLQKANAGIVELTAQKERLQTELGRLSERDYLESLARQDLSYTRPGEELYIVTGEDESVAPAPGASGDDSSLNGSTPSGTGSTYVSGPGFLERALTPILDVP